MKATHQNNPLSNRQSQIMSLVALAVVIIHGVVDSPLAAVVAVSAILLRLTPTVLPRFHPGRMLLFIMTAAGVAALAYQGLENGYSATGVRALQVLTGLKILEMRSVRDLYVTSFVILFLVATLFLTSQTMGSALFGLLVVFGLLTVLVEANSHSDSAQWRLAVRSAVQLIVISIPFTILLFIIFPRLPGPLWHFGLGDRIGLTGLSDRMTPGALSSLAQSDRIAFRARFDDPPPARQALYWRGPVLWRTDGRQWTRRGGQTSLAASQPVFDESESHSYQLIMEPNNKRWILALDLPSSLPPKTTLNDDFELLAEKDIDNRTDYRLVSVSSAPSRELTDDQRHAGLQLPSTLSPRVTALAATWRTQAGTNTAAVVKSALDHFRNQPFGYTLTPPPLGDDPVDRFLFETRKGFCEHYAAAFVTLMRASGIPARIVTGYQGGELNPHNDYLVVRQWDAHAWAEVWLDNAGWVRVDPTAAVAPERIEQGIDVPATLASGGLAIFSTGTGGDTLSTLLRQAGWLWDSVEMAWYSRVVNFTQERQQALWSLWGLDGLDTGVRQLVIATLILTGVGFTGLLTLGYRRRKRAPDPAQRLYTAFCRRLAKVDLIRGPSEGPQAFASRIANQLSRPASEQSQAITRIYVQLRYGRHPDSGAIGRLKRMIRGFHP